MRRAGWVLLAGLATAAMTTGCGGGDETGAGGGGGEGGGGEGGSTSTAPPTTTTGTTNPSATTGTTNPSTTSTASGTPGECDDIVADNPCGQCAGSNCCDELLACGEDADCNACLASQGEDEAACASPVVESLNSCLTGSCSAECGGGTGTVAPACDAPATSPSGGSCVTVDTSTAKPAGCSVDYELSGAGTACEECIETAGDGGCCAEIEACKADANCDKCITEGDPAACQAAEAQLNALDTCAGAKCQAACSTPVRKCNPINNDGCAAGENCQITNSGSTACFTIPGSAGVCETCTEANYCAPGSICSDPSSGSGQCIKYCCNDGDCGTGTCDKAILEMPDIGVCLAK